MSVCMLLAAIRNPCPGVPLPAASLHPVALILAQANNIPSRLRIGPFEVTVLELLDLVFCFKGRCPDQADT